MTVRLFEWRPPATATSPAALTTGEAAPQSGAAAESAGSTPGESPSAAPASDAAAPARPRVAANTAAQPPPRAHHLDRRALAIIEAANAGSDDELLRTIVVAVWLGVSEEWLEIGRSRGYGPPYHRLSPRRVRYRRGDVKAWLTERAHRHTAEYFDPAAPRAGRKPGSRVVDGKLVLPSSREENNVAR